MIVVTTRTGSTPAATSTRCGSNTMSRLVNSTMVTRWLTIVLSPVTSRSSMAAMSPDSRVSRSPRRWRWKYRSDSSCRCA